jgi:multisubunit Na+/H+ antiporter MnhG subunit
MEINAKALDFRGLLHLINLCTIFIAMKNLPPQQYLEIICLIIGLIILFVKRDLSFYLKLLLVILFVTVIVELIGFFIGRKSGATTIPLYNFFITFEFTFYLWMIREIVKNIKARSIMRYIFLIYPILCLTNIFFIQGFYKFQSVTYSLGCLLIMAFSIYYFFELFQTKHSVNLVRQPAFWICSGLLFYYSCTFFIFAFVNFLPRLSLSTQQLILNAINLLNILLYLMFSIAFLCRFRITKSQQSLS